MMAKQKKYSTKTFDSSSNLNCDIVFYVYVFKKKYE